jgi:hypothetical protein
VEMEKDHFVCAPGLAGDGASASMEAAQ